MEATTHPLPTPRQNEPQPFRILTEDKRNIILKYLLQGHPYNVCCGMARVKLDTFKKALDIGRKEWQDYEEHDMPLTDRAKFAMDVDFAMAKSDVDFASDLDTAMKKDPVKGWVGAFTRRERARPEQYSRKSTVNIQHDTQPVIIIEKRGGMDWQMGNIGGQRQLPSADVVDTVMMDIDA